MALRLSRFILRRGQTSLRISASFSTSTTSAASEKNLIKSRYPDVPLDRSPYFDFFWSNTQKHAQRTALVNGLTGNSLDFTQAFEAAKKFGYALRKHGAKKGEVIGVMLPNCVEFPLVFTGATSAGMAVTTMNPIYTAREISRQLKMSGATWAITNKAHLPIIKEATASLEDKSIDWRSRIIIVDVDDEKVDGCLHLQSFIDEVQNDEVMEAIPIDVDNDLACLPYSSGTTGLPKGVMLTHFNLVANMCQEVRGPPEISICVENPEEQPVTLCVLPLYHIYALNVTMGSTLFCGGKLVMLPEFKPKTFVEALDKYRPTFLHLAPPLLAFCADYDGVTPDMFSRMQHVMTAAAPTGPALLQRFKKKMPHVTLREGWGMSETSPIGLVLPLNDIVEGSCGAVVPNTVCKVVDVSTGENLPANQKGELCLKGPQVMKGYLDNEKATQETIQDGWLHSGDIAYYDEKGYIFIVDRLKELIKVKGFQVPPAELEDLLRSMEGVADVAVIGIPNEKLGEAPRAYVVKKEDAPETMDETAVINFVAENTAPYKHLVGGVEFVSAIPKSNSGKILRKDLKATYKA